MTTEKLSFKDEAIFLGQASELSRKPKIKILASPYWLLQTIFHIFFWIERIFQDPV